MGQIITVNLYLWQLDGVQQALKYKKLALVKCKSVLFLQNNARPHETWIAKDSIWQLGWRQCAIHLTPQTLSLLPFLGQPHL